MSTTTARTTSATGRRPHAFRTALALGPRSAAYDAVLIPGGLGAVADVVTAHPERAVARWERRRATWLRTPPAVAGERPSILLITGHAVASLLLGVLALIPFGIELLFVLRGVLYGLVDGGPYDNSWGGPTRAGAWAMHFAISVPLAIAAVLVLVGIAAVHSKLTARLSGARLASWVLPIVLVACAAGVLFMVAWVRQI